MHQLMVIYTASNVKVILVFVEINNNSNENIAASSNYGFNPFNSSEGNILDMSDGPV